jgi:flagellar biosynthesis/type III secretory pathway M-ring protein FliF/YscJ
VKETSEKFDPEGKVVLHESVMSSKSTGPNGARGPAGTASNLPPLPPNAAPVNPPSANEEVIESDYAVTRVNHSQEEQQENINRLTVAVMLIPPKPIDEVPLEESLGITPDEAGNLVKQSIGFKEGRDQIQVSIGKSSEIQAEAATLDKEIIAVQQWQNIGSALRASSLGVAALSLLAMGLLAMRRKPAPAVAGAMASADSDAAELEDLKAVAGTIRAWLEEPATVRMDRPATVGGK